MHKRSAFDSELFLKMAFFLIIMKFLAGVLQTSLCASPLVITLAKRKMLSLRAVNQFYGSQHTLWNVNIDFRKAFCMGIVGLFTAWANPRL